MNSRGFVSMYSGDTHHEGSGFLSAAPHDYPSQRFERLVIRHP